MIFNLLLFFIVANDISANANLLIDESKLSNLEHAFLSDFGLLDCEIVKDEV